MTIPKLPPGQQLAAPHKWPLVGEKAPRQSDDPWEVAIAGHVAKPCRWTLAEIAALPQEERTIDIHCVTRWSKLGMRFGGVSLAKLLDLAQPQSTAKYLLCHARSERNHHTSLVLQEALELEAFIALAADGKPLSSDHGGPVRMIVPGRYFYKSVKWLEQLTLSDHDQPGYWEAIAGYHNHADPWREQRYEPGDWSRLSLSKRLALLASEQHDLRGFDVASATLPALHARGKLLRDGNFRGATLTSACFETANLSNAHFEDANLRQANFRGADVEGANFSGADLRAADFTGASLFGASFCDESGQHGARLDVTTRIDPAALEQLTPVQANYVQQNLPAAPG